MQGSTYTYLVTRLHVCFVNPWIDEQIELIAKPRQRNPLAIANSTRVWISVVSKTCSEMLLHKPSKLKRHKLNLLHLRAFAMVMWSVKDIVKIYVYIASHLVLLII